ncbi:MAG TPA: alkaline phosphatase family protein [Mycobacteriales bacterium]|nr:alkaline phosphatase family protein [Mycobacteriales bacterium]
MDTDRELTDALARRVQNMSRRELIAGISAVGAAAFLGIPGLEASSAAEPRVPSARSARTLASRAAMTKPAGSDIGAIEHVVFLMMENRSYDHYFGAYPRGRGFDDHPKHSLGVFAQDYPKGTSLSPSGKLLPFRLDLNAGEDCTHDLTHDWGPMHKCWNHGKMDRFVRVHTSDANEGNPDGCMTMGYYTRDDLPLHWALADQFTLCDNYHCSILGPTHPNRVMSYTGTIDPAGTHGGPITDTNSNPDVRWSCEWTTVQELLEDKGVPWKVYHPSWTGATGRYADLSSFWTFNPTFYDASKPAIMVFSDHVLPYFKAFKKPTSALYRKAFNPTFPHDFIADLKGGTFPKVSWIIPPLGFDEHPSANPSRGAWFIQEIIRQLTAHPHIWAKTALFITYDENDGWFDHVPPPTPPKGTAGEWLTAKKISPETDGIRGPLGLGVRVPMLVVSPFSRGGHISSHTFDHTSQLKFLEHRFGIEVDNISRWRRNTVGALTHSLLRHTPSTAPPSLPAMPIGPSTPTGECAQEDFQTGGASPVIPVNQAMPTQHGTTVPATRYLDTHRINVRRSSAEKLPLRSGRSTSTTKSAANALAEGRSVQPPRGR